MEERVLRLRIHPVLYQRYKVICVKNKLSIPKQTSELVRHFVENMEDYEENINKIKYGLIK
jgi:hypothetical protein